MSLSPFVSFQSRFGTYLLTYPLTLIVRCSAIYLNYNYVTATHTKRFQSVVTKLVTLPYVHSQVVNVGLKKGTITGCVV